MNLLLEDAFFYGPDGFTRGSLAVAGQVFANPAECPRDAVRCSISDYTVFPGFTDVHVHLREPGFSCKETIAAGTRAAARGGYTTVCPMPNVNPVPDCLEHLRPQLERIGRDAVVHTVPYGAITRGENGAALADLAALAAYVAGFSDDGKGVQNEAVMRAAMVEARGLGKVIAAHCEDTALLGPWAVHDGAYAKAHGLPGNPSESEWRQVQRDLRLAEETGCAYHVCHVSTQQSVALIRAAKARGVDVTCETAPHYLLLDDSLLRDEGNFRMNPPIRSWADRKALVEGLLDGTIDMIATDHAPHTAAEKAGGLLHSLNGVVGLETAFPVLYTGLVRTGLLPLERLAALLHDGPAKRFGLGTPLAPGQPADFSVWNLHEAYIIDPDTFLSQGRATPFGGWTVFGKCLLTVCGGEVAWADPDFQEVLT